MQQQQPQQQQQQPQQQQQFVQMQPMMATYAPPNNVTTDIIQQYLDENKQLILAILENQNSGKVEECAQYQARLQRNLMYLAAIADSQPQMATLAQYPPSAVVQSGPRYVPTQQAQQMTPQSLMAARSPMLYAQSPLSAMQQQQQQQQSLHSQMGLSSSGNTGLNMLHSETTMASGGGPITSGASSFPDFSRSSRANKQDGGGGNAGSVEGSEQEGN